MRSGDHVTSLLSIIEQVIGIPSAYKTVEAVAGEDDTRVIRIPVEGFVKVAEEHYTAFRQLTQVVAQRMHRVTFVALYRFLGLGKELTPERSVGCDGCEPDMLSNLEQRATEERVAGADHVRPAVRVVLCCLIFSPSSPSLLLARSRGVPSAIGAGVKGHRHAAQRRRVRLAQATLFFISFRYRAHPADVASA